MNAPLGGFDQYDSPTFEGTLGEFLRRERELRALSLEEISLTTRIPLRTLRAIEEDRFDELPGDVFIRGFLGAYARILEIDPQPLLSRYEEQFPQPSTPAFLMKSGSTPDRGRRFGIAIAVVVLLILFTLALSIVLRPRYREAPIELSGRQLDVLLVNRHLS